MVAKISAYVFVALAAIVIFFQLCLASGLPWGVASMGGKFPGKYPLKMRLIAVLNSFVLVFFAIIILTRSGLAFSNMFTFSKAAIWFIAVFFIGGTGINSITPSKIERIWAPVNLLLLITCIIIAFN